MTSFHRDLLQRFMSSNHFAHKYQQKCADNEEEEIELSLGLSLNGRFGVDPKANKLSRSSSIPDFIHNRRTKDNDTICVVPMANYTPLARTCSLPRKTEEEWRKRKELQSIRRMEAKRKRSENQRNSKAARERYLGFEKENCEEDKKKEFLPFGVPSWVNGGRGACGIKVKGEKGNVLRTGAAVNGGLPPAVAVASSQGSIGLHGSGSLGISEFESQPVQGVNTCTEGRSPASVQSSPEGKQKPTITDKSEKFARPKMEKRSNKPTVGGRGAKEVGRDFLENMPGVSTTGDGSNGKRIEGFLYQYRKGEEVRMVCVCHGSFLSPAEFVKHAGGGDVAHPLKHIVMNPSLL